MSKVCGELVIPQYYTPFAIKFGKVSIGNCLNQEYSEFDRTAEISMGPLANQISIYEKYR